MIETSAEGEKKNLMTVSTPEIKSRGWPQGGVGWAGSARRPLSWQGGDTTRDSGLTTADSWSDVKDRKGH